MKSIAFFRSMLIVMFMMPLLAHGQEKLRGKAIFFPTPMHERNWLASFGVMTFATPAALTEQFRLNVPAGDIQLMRQVHGGFHLNARLLIQILQNHASIGPRWATELSKRWNFSVGTDLGWWKGHLDIEAFDTEATGWDAYPNFSFGYKAGRNVSLTFKTEAILKISYSTRVGRHEITRDISTYNGLAWSLYVEQPFFGRTHIALGFTARYTNFFWATWALFNTHEKPLLFRQITIAFIP
ncbi:MAG: hypothetical protein M3R08_02440 [Bacteroidota bacterium]|nr:hypothetical protein [Bacteroidota bacterium]